MDMYMRRKCQECRLKKCLNVGMRPECVVPETQCAIKRKEKKMQKEKDKQQIPIAVVQPQMNGTMATATAGGTVLPHGQQQQTNQQQQQQQQNPHQQQQNQHQQQHNAHHQQQHNNGSRQTTMLTIVTTTDTYKSEIPMLMKCEAPPHNETCTVSGICGCFVEKKAFELVELVDLVPIQPVLRQ